MSLKSSSGVISIATEGCSESHICPKGLMRKSGIFTKAGEAVGETHIKILVSSPLVPDRDPFAKPASGTCTPARVVTPRRAPPTSSLHYKAESAVMSQCRTVNR